MNSSDITAIPTFGYARGAIVRHASGGPNMLVVRDLLDVVCVIRCEGDAGGTLRLRDEPKGDLVQVLDHDGRNPLATEIATLSKQLANARRVLKVALHALENVDGPFIEHDGAHGIFLAKEHDCTCWDAEQEVRAFLDGGGE